MTPTVTLKQAKSIIKALAREQSVLLLSPPGVGKSDSIMQAAAEVNLPCRSLLGTQIAPEDVSGIPRIVGERSVFCPPRILLPENPEPFCLFLDELPACTPDIQKSFYSLLLERRLGEHPLPKGTWVVAAGNRAEDRSLVRLLSAALINRVVILNVRVDVKEWLAWAKEAKVREEILTFILFSPDSLMRPVPQTPSPFSTPRAWASLSRSMDLAEAEGILTPDVVRALAFGRISAEDAAIFCDFVMHHIDADTICRNTGERLVVTISGVEYAFRWCPAGTFMMGSPDDEKERDKDESQHKVTLTRGFWLLETPVTQLMWQSVMGTGFIAKLFGGGDPSRFKGENLPVEQVSWNDCQKFIAKLNGSFKSSLRFRLPSESEWEYACRAGTTGAYAGTGNLDSMGWYFGNSGLQTHEVKTKQPNAWGLYDMHGNVWEWCNDWYDSDYYRKSPSTDPTGPDSGSNRVGRGGSWFLSARYCRSANRDGYDPAGRSICLGFRLALSSTH